MLNYLHSYFTAINHDPLHEHTKKNQSKYVYRDELDMNTTSPSKLRRGAYYKTAEAKSPLLQRENDQEEEKRGKTKVVNEERKDIRVKVRMTKEQAIRLLSKCKKGGLMEFGEVAHELSKTTADRIRVVDSSTVMGDRVLPSIAEEF